MRKIALILLSLLIATGAYALVVTLFPDTVSFPRIPTSVGTIGNSLAGMLGVSDIGNYVGDGTVANSERLGGIGASGYLQHNTCTNPGDVWLGIDPSGSPLCGPKGSLLAMEIGTLTGVTGVITITKRDNSTVSGVDGDTLYVGDILSTAAASSGTIAFTDASIIRLDELTTVELSLGENSDGDEIAQVILNNGDLWGRVLTSTGINFEAGGYIAGVRGTSLSVNKNNSNVTFLVVDSTISTNTAAKIYYTGQTIPITEVGSGTKITVLSGSSMTPPVAPPTITTPGKNALLTESDWASENTIRDMEYMLTIMEDSTTTVPIGIKVESEFDATTPTLGNTSMCNALASNNTTASNCSLNTSIANIPTGVVTDAGTLVNNASADEINKKLAAKNIICENTYKGVYWWTINRCVLPIKGGTITVGGDTTDSDKTIVLMANYVLPGVNSTTANPPSGEGNSGEDGEENMKRLGSNDTPGWTVVNPFGGIQLKGRTVIIDPVYEKYYGDTITDDGNFQKNDVSQWFTQEYARNGGIIKIGALVDIFGKIGTDVNGQNLRYLINTLVDEGWVQIAMKNPANGRLLSENYGGWDQWKYPDGIWLRKGLSALNAYPGPLGVSIDAVGKYISYPLSEIGDLRGKTIAIELASPVAFPAGTSTEYVADFGNLKYYLQANANGGFDLKQKIGTNAATTVNGGLTEKIIRFTIPINQTLSAFVIGNEATTGFQKPLYNSIKSIKILN